MLSQKSARDLDSHLPLQMSKPKKKAKGYKSKDKLKFKAEPKTEPKEEGNQSKPAGIRSILRFPIWVVIAAAVLLWLLPVTLALQPAR
ncbi:MAG: hypothetical protein AB8E74_03485 [Prochlorococcus sp.]|nr:hypothetical protein [Prochlorococcaceae cyanobacterium Fu_MAG_50]